MIARYASTAFVLFVLIGAALLVGNMAATSARPGKQADGRILLPNGWLLSPAGRAVEVEVGALTCAQSPDGAKLAVLNCGVGPHSVSILDVATEKVTEKIPVKSAWVGIAYHRSGDRIYVSGGTDGVVYELTPGSPKPTRTFTLAKSVWVSGVAVSADGSFLYAGTMDTGEVFKVNLADGRTVARTKTMGRVYNLLVGPGGDLLVSDWLRSRVLRLDEDLAQKAVYRVGLHPTEMALTKGGRLFTACAEDNCVYAVDLASGETREKIEVSVRPNSPEGSSPTSLAVSPDGKTLCVAVADNNCVALVDISAPGQSKLSGFIPTGWYTCGVRFAPDGERLLALASKGSISKPNQKREYIGSLFKGEVRFVDMPDAKRLRAYTVQTLANCPYRNEQLRPLARPADCVLPPRPGEESPIKYVIYIVKENRTYDQVMGDMPVGNSDPTLCIYGEKITPNQHKLAREFALLDNFYVDAEVSADGHNWSNAAYANDYVEKVWPYNYGGHGGDYDFEGTNPLARPAGGYIWDAARRGGLEYRTYGEYTDEKDGKFDGKVNLQGHACPDYPGWNQRVKDMTRFEKWLAEFRMFEKSGKMPGFQILTMPQNHTAGSSPGHWTPNAMVADNDEAVGRLVEAVTHSRFWRETAIFILEDDAQNGPDHVDAHRSPCLVISPYSRLGVVDSNLYTTCSVLRSIELLLGLQPLNQYDAGARPMYSLFRGRPNLSPYVHVPPQVSTDEMNPSKSSGAAASLSLDFSEPDRIDMDKLNRILWRVAKGPGVPYPGVRRSALSAVAR